MLRRGSLGACRWGEIERVAGCEERDQVFMGALPNLEAPFSIVAVESTPKHNGGSS